MNKKEVSAQQNNIILIKNKLDIKIILLDFKGMVYQEQLPWVECHIIGGADR